METLKSSDKTCLAGTGGTSVDDDSVAEKSIKKSEGSEL